MRKIINSWQIFRKRVCLSCGIGRYPKNSIPDRISHTFQLRKQRELNMAKITTQKQLKDIATYNPITGYFKGISFMLGKYIVGDGYLQIGIYKNRYLSHRLAWLYVYGYFPEGDIDHINRIKTDNRIKNLREVWRLCNIRNSKTPRNNKSGVKGVSWNKASNKWESRIGLNNKSKNLGLNIDFVEAVCLRLAAEQCLDWGSCDIESSASKYIKNNSAT